MKELTKISHTNDTLGVLPSVIRWTFMLYRQNYTPKLDHFQFTCTFLQSPTSSQDKIISEISLQDKQYMEN